MISPAARTAVFFAARSPASWAALRSPPLAPFWVSRP